MLNLPPVKNIPEDMHIIWIDENKAIAIPKNPCKMSSNDTEDTEQTTTTAAAYFAERRRVARWGLVFSYASISHVVLVLLLISAGILPMVTPTPTGFVLILWLSVISCSAIAISHQQISDQLSTFGIFSTWLHTVAAGCYFLITIIVIAGHSSASSFLSTPIIAIGCIVTVLCLVAALRASISDKILISFHSRTKN